MLGYLFLRIFGLIENSPKNKFYYYYHDSSDSLWKQRHQSEPNFEVDEITEKMYLRRLAEFGETDGDHKIERA